MTLNLLTLFTRLTEPFEISYICKAPVPRAWFPRTTNLALHGIHRASNKVKSNGLWTCSIIFGLSMFVKWPRRSLHAHKYAHKIFGCHRIPNSSYRGYQRSIEAKGSFSIVLTHKPRLHVAVNKGGFARGSNFDNSYCLYERWWFAICKSGFSLQTFFATLNLEMVKWQNAKFCVESEHLDHGKTETLTLMMGNYPKESDYFQVKWMYPLVPLQNQRKRSFLAFHVRQFKKNLHLFKTKTSYSIF